MATAPQLAGRFIGGGLAGGIDPLQLLHDGYELEVVGDCAMGVGGGDSVSLDLGKRLPRQQKGNPWVIVGWATTTEDFSLAHLGVCLTVDEDGLESDDTPRYPGPRTIAAMVGYGSGMGHPALAILGDTWDGKVWLHFHSTANNTAIDLNFTFYLIRRRCGANTPE